MEALPSLTKMVPQQVWLLTKSRIGLLMVLMMGGKFPHGLLHESGASYQAQILEQVTSCKLLRPRHQVTYGLSDTLFQTQCIRLHCTGMTPHGEITRSQAIQDMTYWG